MRMAGKVGAKRETSKEKKGGSGVCVGGGGRQWQRRYTREIG
jgi:hypothetical protein